MAGRHTALMIDTVEDILRATVTTCTSNTADERDMAEAMTLEVLTVLEQDLELEDRNDQLVEIMGRWLLSALALDLTAAQGGHLQLVTDDDDG